MNDLAPSRSSQKRESLALQKLAEELSDLPPDDIRALELPSEIIDALLKAGTMKKRSGFRRQIRYIGGLLRRIDSGQVSETFSKKEDQDRLRTACFHQAEQWRDRLMEDDDTVMEEILTAFPQADRQHIRQLARNARGEQAAGKPPRARRDLFRALQRMMETS